MKDFHTRISDASELAINSTEYCRSRLLTKIENLQASRVLSQELGFQTGYWPTMEERFKAVLEAQEMTRLHSALHHQQTKRLLRFDAERDNDTFYSWTAQEQDARPLQAPAIIAAASEKHFEKELIKALLAAETSRSEERRVGKECPV